MQTQLFSTILVIHTGTPAAAHIADLAVELSHRLQARLLVLGLFIPFSPDAEVLGLDHEDALKASPSFQAEVNRLSHLAAALNVSISSEMVEGIPEVQIEEKVKADDVDLIIVGHRMVSGIKRWFEGSTSETLVRKGKTAVLVIPEEEIDSRDLPR
jgi:nucleotide-binding universal stress UspA family protein